MSKVGAKLNKIIFFARVIMPSMRFLIANWKMAPENAVQTKFLARATAKIARTYKKNLKFIICPPVIYLTSAQSVSKTLDWGGQDVSVDFKVASTGQVSATMLKAAGTLYCIVGHSESRHRGDTNEIVKIKIERLMEKRIQPILCVGEKSRDAQGWYLGEVKDQIESAFWEVPKNKVKNFLIAYEPVWAIGENATRSATPRECLEMVIYIRKIISDLYDEKTAHSVTILYGGSVNPENALFFIEEGQVNGLLVGRVSLVPKDLEALARAINF